MTNPVARGSVRSRIMRGLRQHDRMHAMNADSIAQLIRKGLPDAEVQVQSDDNTHFSAVIVTDVFAGKRTLQRHQLVYATLGALMGREIHALTMQTFTVAERQAARQPSP